MARAKQPETIPGPDGRPLTVWDLPLLHERRWTPLRKARVIVAVRGGLPSVPMMMRQAPAGSLPLRAEVTTSNGYARFEQ